ncbi:MAG: hypothetical protein IKB99_02305 [Lentisphaeria bacterium]|nr:hypothetical protein [Lentisphaeria bacterium]
MKIPKKKGEKGMHEYEASVLINGISLKVTVSANTPTQARQILEAQYPAARMINVHRQIS